MAQAGVGRPRQAILQKDRPLQSGKRRGTAKHLQRVIQELKRRTERQVGFRETETTGALLFFQEIRIA
jgi:hypothetical protein